MPTSPDPDLMRIFNFTATDLETNRAGRITEFQSQRLLKEVALSRVLWSVSAYIILISIIFRNATGSMLFLIIPFEFIVCMVVIVAAIHNKQTVASDIGSGVAMSVSDSISLRSRRNGGDVIISDKTLKINRHENKELKKYLDDVPSQRQFRVYYVPHSKKILSIEAI